MELRFTKKDDTTCMVEPIYAVRSAYLKGKVAEIVTKYKADEKQKQLLSALREAFPEGELSKMLESGSMEHVLRLAVITDKLDMTTINKRDYSIELHNDNITIEVFRAMIDVLATVTASAKHLDAENQDLLKKSLAGDVKSTFWQSQDILEIEKEVESLKDKFRL